MLTPAIGKIDVSQLRPVNTSWCLEKICESNYQKLVRLIPNLSAIGTSTIGHPDEGPSLHLAIVERNPYTLTIVLSHIFTQTLASPSHASVTIRVYLDAKLAEVISDHDRPAVASVFGNPGRSVEIQEYKWRLNYFLQKWLDHCLASNYRFGGLSGCAA